MTPSPLDHVRQMKSWKPQQFTASASHPAREPDTDTIPAHRCVPVLGVVQDGRVIWNVREHSAAHDR